MVRWRFGGFPIALGMGLVLTAAAAASDPSDDAPPPSQRPGWQTTTVWDRLFSSDKPAPPRPQTPAADRDSSPAPHAGHDRDRDPGRRPALDPVRPTEEDEVSSDRDREEKAYLRRVAVCLRLHEIAQANKDEELEKKAQQLDERIWAVYSQHTNRPRGGDDESNFDDRRLQRRPEATRPTSPAHAANGLESPGRPAFPEDKP